MIDTGPYSSLLRRSRKFASTAGELAAAPPRLDQEPVSIIIQNAVTTCSTKEMV
jgi:hypothetical protein